MEKYLQTFLSFKFITAAWDALQQIDILEGIILLALFGVSICLGILVNRAIDRLGKRDWRTHLLDYLAPLSASLITMLCIITALSVYEHYEVAPTILPFGLKVAVAWFAIRLVVLMSSRKTAGWFIALVIAPGTLLQIFGLWEPLTETLQAWKISIGSVNITALAIMRSIATICILFWLAGFSSDIIENRLRKISSLRASNRTLIMKIFQIILYLVIFFIALRMLGVSLTALSVFGGALGVGIGFGLQKIASNFISGLILLFEKSIEVDDLIQLEDGTTGFVRHTGARYTLLETADGREILIPNEDFITQRMVNWTYSSKKARVEIRVNVGYECDLHLARELMLECANQHPRCIKEPKPLCSIDNFGDSGIGLVLYFWVADVTDGRMEPKSDVMLAIWDAFKARNISIPYPQQEIRILHNTLSHAPQNANDVPQKGAKS